MGAKKMSAVIKGNMAVYDAKTKLSLAKLIFLGILAGVFIAIGASSSSAATYGITNTGVAKTLAGVIFPVGLMLVVIMGAELFTGDCLMILGVVDKKIKLTSMIRVLVVVFVSNLVGSLIVVLLVNQSGQLDYGNGALAASVIKTAYTKINLGFVKCFCSGIMCNILVCLAVLFAGAAHHIMGKIWGIFFCIWAFVIAGYEHCVANMYYIPAGILAKTSDTYYDAAVQAGMTATQMDSMTMGRFFIDNLLPVTLGNIVGGMLFVAIPLYIGNKHEIQD
ncbi:MAG: formate/nitrite transporter family protein [Lachnospiraceae bacterium]|nr:formate/nitrite transporter family protein [Lachnospiraceae bacterium]